MKPGTQVVVTINGTELAHGVIEYWQGSYAGVREPNGMLYEWPWDTLSTPD